MRVCLMIEGQDEVSWDQWLAIAQAAEAAGLEGLFRSDHYLAIRRPGRVGSLDAWTTIAALAACTKRIRLGTLVSPVTFRPASILAKSVLTVDHVSGGRVELGLGAGWYEAAHEAYGMPFPPLRERLDALESQLVEIIRQWTHQEEYWPKPVQVPRPPLIIGGLAKPRTVQLAVKYADEYNTWLPSVDEARARRRSVDEAATEVGRSPLLFSVMLSCVVGRTRAEVARRLSDHESIALESDPPPLSGSVAEVSERLGEYADAGVERVFLQQFRHEDVEMIELLGELAAAVA